MFHADFLSAATKMFSSSFSSRVVVVHWLENKAMHPSIGPLQIFLLAGCVSFGSLHLCLLIVIHFFYLGFTLQLRRTSFSILFLPTMVIYNVSLGCIFVHRMSLFLCFESGYEFNMKLKWAKKKNSRCIRIDAIGVSVRSECVCVYENNICARRFE